MCKKEMNEAEFDSTGDLEWLDQSVWHILAYVLVEVMSTTRGAALCAAGVNAMLMTITLSNQMVLPGGLVVSPLSWLWVLVDLALSCVSGVIAVLLLYTSVPTALAIVTAGCIPTVALLLGLLWGAPVTTIILVLVLFVGMGCLVFGNRKRSFGIANAVCVATVACACLLAGLMPVGRALYLRYPELFSVQYARVGADYPDGGDNRASYLAKRILDTDDECTAVIVTPFCVAFEGELMSMVCDAKGNTVLQVGSAYAHSYTQQELADIAERTLANGGNTIPLYTRWIDGCLWAIMMG